MLRGDFQHPLCIQLAVAASRLQYWGGDKFHGERGAQAYFGGLGACPQWGLGAKLLVGGGRSPPEASEFSVYETHISTQNCHQIW